MRTELIETTAAGLVIAALRAPAPPEPIVLDTGTGLLVAPPAAFRELVEPGSRLETRAALAAAGVVHGGRVPPLLRAALAAVRAPERQLTLEGAGAAVEAWRAGAAAALTTLDDDGRVRLVPLPAAALAATLARLIGLEEDVPAPGGGERRLAPGELAAVLAAGGDDSLPSVHTHRRLAPLELVGAADGWRRIVPDGDALVLRPESTAALREAIAALVQRA
jgi:hypothetical protein